MTTEGHIERQPWNQEVSVYRQLRFLQYFCNFEDTPLDETMNFVPADFNVEKTKSELLDYILNDLKLDTFQVSLGERRSVPEAEVVRNMFIEHFGLKGKEPEVTYKELAKKYNFGGNKILEIFRIVLNNIRLASTIK